MQKLRPPQCTAIERGKSHLRTKQSLFGPTSPLKRWWATRAPSKIHVNLAFSCYESKRHISGVFSEWKTVWPIWFLDWICVSVHCKNDVFISYTDRNGCHQCYTSVPGRLAISMLAVSQYCTFYPLWPNLCQLNQLISLALCIQFRCLVNCSMLVK